MTWWQVTLVAVLTVGLAAGWHRYSMADGTLRRLGTSLRPVLWWFRIGVWLGALAMVASGPGKGRLRKWGLFVGVVTFLLWLFRGHR